MQKTLMSLLTAAALGLAAPYVAAADGPATQPVSPSGPAAERGTAGHKEEITDTRTLADGENTLTLTTRPGQEDHLLAKDRAGRVIFDGPVATAGQLAKLPASLAPKLQRLQAPPPTATAAKPADGVDAKGAIKDEPPSGPDLAAKINLALQKKEYKDNPNILNLMAWTMVDPEVPPDHPDLDLALKVALRANEIAKRQRGDILDTLARVYFLRGELDKAIATETEALAKATEDDKAEMTKTLAEYKAKKKSQK